MIGQLQWQLGNNFNYDVEGPTPTDKLIHICEKCTNDYTVKLCHEEDTES